MINEHQAHALALIINSFRPNDWGTHQILAVLSEHQNTPTPFPRIVEAAIRAARNPAIKSPTAIFLPGKHWDTDTDTVADDQPAPTPNTPCEDHPHEPAHTCRCCWADVRAGDRSPDHIGKTTTPTRRTPPPTNFRELYENALPPTPHTPSGVTQHPEPTKTPQHQEPAT
ncbi:hypothetical protein [Zhihengliuella halotolerans]|uniref:hypothetical protein n=1 Tax=Zhihengliuella halotolerans TaxID=370736 RepID=UPI0011AFA7C5|nr:hypothetical protein [Zhihengliuella halotolerans]